MRSPIAEALLAETPDGTGLELFGQFVGGWAFEGWQIGPDGKEAATHGYWDFGYILGGRAVQDVLRYEGGDCGITVRVPRADGSWEVVWISAAHKAVHLSARPEGDRIVLTGGDGDRRVRWSFTDITAGSVLWKGEELTGRGAFRLAEEIRLSRG